MEIKKERKTLINELQNLSERLDGQMFIEVKEIELTVSRINESVPPQTSPDINETELTKNIHKRWYLRVNILGPVVMALFDTGAGQSYLNERLFKSLKIQG